MNSPVTSKPPASANSVVSARFNSALRRALLLPIAILLFLVGLGGWETAALRQTRERLRQSETVLAAGWGVEAAVQQSVAAWRAAYAFPNEQSFGAEFARSRDRVRRRLDDLDRRFESSPVRRAQLREVGERYEGWLEAAGAALGPQPGGPDAGVVLRSARLRTEVLDALHELVKVERGDHDTSGRALDAQAKEAAWSISLYALCATVIGTGLTRRKLRDLNAAYEASLAEAEARQRELERASVEARRAEERLLCTTQSLAEAIIATDDAGNVELMNPEAERLTGRTLEDVRGRPAEEVFVLREDPDSGAAPVGSSWSVGADVARSSAVLVPMDGAPVPVVMSASAIRGLAGAPSGIVMCLRDVTESRRAEQAVAQAQRNMREIVARDPDGIVIGQFGPITSANDAFTRLLGFDAEELRGKDLLDLVAPDERAIIAQRLEALRTTGEPTPPRETRLVRKDGSIVFTETTSQRVELADGPAAVVRVRDLTARKQLTMQLMQMDRTLAIGTLAAGVSHEINNPLAYMLPNLEFIGAELARVEWPASARGTAREVARAVEEVLDGATRVHEIVRDLRTYSRAETAESGPVDVRGVVETAVNLSAAETRHRADVELRLSSLPKVSASEGKLVRVLVKLLVNAAQAMPEGPPDANRITVRAEREGANVVIAVEDNGSGIAPEVLPRIFDPFFTTRDVGLGTGLGLTLCQNHVRSFGGSMRVTSELGKGSRFEVVLPVFAEAGRAPAAATSASAERAA